MKNIDAKKRLLNTVDLVLSSNLELDLDVSKEHSFNINFIITRGDYIREVYTLGRLTEVNTLRGEENNKLLNCYISFYKKFDCPIVSFVIIKDRNSLSYNELEENRATYVISDLDFYQYRKKAFIYSVCKNNTKSDVVFNQYCDIIEDRYSEDEVIHTLEDIM